MNPDALRDFWLKKKTSSCPLCVRGFVFQGKRSSRDLKFFTPMEVDKDTGGVRHSKAEQYLPKIPMLNYEKMVSRSSEINYWSSGLHELQHHRYEGVHEDARGFCDVQQDPGESRFDLRVSRRSVPERLSGHHHGRPAAARGAMQFLTNAVKAFAMERVPKHRHQAC